MSNTWRRRRAGTVALAVVTVAAALAAVSMAWAARDKTVASPCGTRTGPPATYTHVIWIWMENHSAGQVVGSRSAPYITSLAKSCGLAANYTAITHPSLPNYIAATSGATQGISDDNSPTTHRLAAVSIFEQAASAKSYEENMPAPCALNDSGRYGVRHNPAAYYTRIAATCTR